jgi:hypothetical protein
MLRIRGMQGGLGGFYLLEINILGLKGPKFAFWECQNGFPGPVQLEGGADAPFRYIAVFLGPRRTFLILRSTFHEVAQKYGGIPPDCCSGLFLEYVKSWKFLKVSPALQQRPRKGQHTRWGSRAGPGKPHAAPYDPMGCLLWIIINFEAFFLLKSVNFGQFWSKWGRKAVKYELGRVPFCTQPEPCPYCAPVCNTGPQLVLFAL